MSCLTAVAVRIKLPNEYEAHARIAVPELGKPVDVHVMLIPHGRVEDVEAVGPLYTFETAKMWCDEIFHDIPVGNRPKPHRVQRIEQYAANVQARVDARNSFSLVEPAEGRSLPGQALRG